MKLLAKATGALLCMLPSQILFAQSSFYTKMADSLLLNLEKSYITTGILSFSILSYSSTILSIGLNVG